MAWCFQSRFGDIFSIFEEIIKYSKPFCTWRHYLSLLSCAHMLSFGIRLGMESYLGSVTNVIRWCWRLVAYMRHSAEAAENVICINVCIFVEWQRRLSNRNMSHKSQLSNRNKSWKINTNYGLSGCLNWFNASNRSSRQQCRLLRLFPRQLPNRRTQRRRSRRTTGLKERDLEPVPQRLAGMQNMLFCDRRVKRNMSPVFYRSV